MLKFFLSVGSVCHYLLIPWWIFNRIDSKRILKNLGKLESKRSSSREHLESEGFLLDVGMAVVGVVMGMEHSGSVSRDFAFRTKFIIDTFWQRSKVRLLVPEKYETIYAVFIINKAGFIYVALMIFPYWEREAGNENKQVRWGKMQNWIYTN